MGVLSNVPPSYFSYYSFCENPNYVFSKEEIYEKVWGAPAYNGDDNTVMVHIRKLREKIEQDPSKPEYIKPFAGLAISSLQSRVTI